MLVNVSVVNPDGQTVTAPNAFEAVSEGDPLWPPTPPTEPISGWLTGTGYPEPRVFADSQWWENLAGDIDNATHFHFQVSRPRNVSTGIVRFDTNCKFFHAQGYTFLGIRKVVRRTNQPSQDWMPNYGENEDGRRNVAITQHEENFWTPVYIDLRGTTPGDYTFEFDAQARRPDGQNVQTRMIFKMHVDEAGTVQATPSGQMQPEGWVSNNESGQQFGYLSVNVWGLREYQSDVSSKLTLVPRATVGRTVRLVVLKNPNMHAHPVDYGTVIFDQTFVQPTSPPKYEIPHPALVPGDRLFWRLSDTGIESIGAAAQVGVITFQ